MGAALGGDFLELTYNHPTVGQGSFFIKANEGNTLDPGGLRTNDDASQVDGGGNMIYQMNRVRGHVEVMCANDFNDRNDIEVAKDLTASPVETEWTISHVSGVVYGFRGKPVGDISVDVNAATFTLKIAAQNVAKIIG